MRTERAMPSSAMLRLFMTDCNACAFLFAFTSASNAPTQTTITIEKSPIATIISTRVKPEFAVRRRPRRFDCRPAADRRRFTSERACSDEENLASLCLTSSILLRLLPLHQYLAVGTDEHAHDITARRKEDDASALRARPGAVRAPYAARAYPC